MSEPTGARLAEAAVAALRRGEIAVLLDDEGVGHLVCDARSVSAEQVVTMLGAGGGIFSVVLAASRCAELRLPEQGRGGGAELGGRRIAASIDAREGTTTGISAAERANTARVVADPATAAADLVVPGHVPPLVASDAGVFARRGPAEAALDLLRLAGAPGTAAICAILDRSGHTAPAARVRAEAARAGLSLATITEVAARRIAEERPLRAVRRERVVTHFGKFTAVGFSHEVTGERHLALVGGTVEGGTEVPLALRSSSPVEDLLANLTPTGGSSLAQVLRRFARAESGVLVLLRDGDADDSRSLDHAAAVLAELGVASVLPLDPSLSAPLAERGVRVAPRRNTPRPRRRRDRCDGFDYELDTAI